MFGPPGYSYVYFTYGMHFCVNFVCMPEGIAEAVLLRAGAIIEGVSLARLRRPAARADHDLARGPARLCQALAIDRALDGVDVCDPGSPLRILGPAAGGSPGPGGPPPAGAIRTGPRVGVSAAAEVPWRFWIDGDPTVSVYRPAAPRQRKSKLVTASGAEDGTMQP
jgi:DNA-3-methyladenine glycosylase